MRRRLWIGCLSACLALTALAVASELYLRFHRSRPTGSVLRADDQLGWDSLPAIVPLKNANRSRVVYFIGDSFTQDRQWPAVAQREAARYGLAFDGYVLGVSGYGTTQEWLKLEREFDRHRPQVVVLQFFAWNDFRDDWPYPAIAYGPETSRRPYLVPDGDRYTLIQERSRLALFRAASQTELWRQIGFRVILRLGDVAARLNIDGLVRWRLPLMVHYTERSTWEPFYRGDGGGAYVHEAFGSTVEAFRRLDAFLKTRGSRLVVIGLDNPFTVDDEVARAWIAPGKPFDPDEPLKRLSDALRALGIPFVNARPLLIDLRRHIGSQVYDPPADNLSGHLQAAGDNLFGVIAAGALRDLQP
jgi:hypothetical protein